MYTFFDQQNPYLNIITDVYECMFLFLFLSHVSRTCSLQSHIAPRRCLFSYIVEILLFTTLMSHQKREVLFTLKMLTIL